MNAVQIIVFFKFDVESAVQTVLLLSHMLSRLLSSLEQVLFQPDSHANELKLVDGIIVNVECGSMLVHSYQYS